MAKKLAIVFGIVFILVGLLAFVENPIVGMGALFETNTLHDLVHLVTGIVLLVIGLKKPASAASALKVFGIVYLVVTVIGLLTAPQGGDVLGLITMSTADHVLHLVLGVVLIALASVASKKDMAMPASTM